MIFFRQKISEKICVSDSKKAKLCKILIVTLIFEKNANFFAENCQKSQKIVIITSTPWSPNPWMLKQCYTPHLSDWVTSKMSITADIHGCLWWQPPPGQSQRGEKESRKECLKLVEFTSTKPCTYVVSSLDVIPPNSHPGVTVMITISTTKLSFFF
jgi:hypothetical protein